MPQPQKWEESVCIALCRLGGEAHFSVLNPEVAKVREEAGIPLSATWEDTVRRVVQQSPRMVSCGHRSGVWRLLQEPTPDS